LEVLNKKRLARINYGAQRQAKAESEADIMPEKNPENKNRFRGMNPHRPRRPASPSTIQTILSAPEFHRIMHLRARGLYRRSGIAPCPEGFYLVVEIIPVTGTITQLRFNDAIYRTDGNALGRIVMAFAFDAGCLVDNIQNAIAFADGFGGTFRYACAAGDAIFSDLHGHGFFTPILIYWTIN